MRTKVSTVIAVAIVMTFAAVADAQPGGRGRGGPGGGGGFGGFGGINKFQLLNLEAVQKEIELTPEQIADIKKLQEELRASSPFGRGRGNTQGSGDNAPQRGRRGQRPQAEPEKESRFEFQPGEYFVQDDRPSAEERREQFRKAMEERQKKEEDGIAKILLPHQVKRLNEIYVQTLGLRALENEEIAKKLDITEKQKEKMAKIQEESRTKMREELGDLFRTDREKAMEKFAELRKDIEKDVLGVLSKKQQKEFEEMKGKPFELDRAALFGGGRGGPGGNRQGGRPQGGRPAPDA